MIKCQSTLDPHAECTMCKNRKTRKPDMTYWQISSSDLDRRTVIVICDECMDQICDCEGEV